MSQVITDDRRLTLEEYYREIRGVEPVRTEAKELEHFADKLADETVEIFAKALKSE